MENLELDDIQGLVRHGYPFCDATAYRLLAIDLPNLGATKRWLAALIGSSCVDIAELSAGVHLRAGGGIALAFSAAGMRKLGLAPDAMKTFPSEFQEGMTAPHRSRLLGDVGANEPGKWRGWPKQDVDILLMVFADMRALPDYLKKIEQMPGHPRVVWDIVGTFDSRNPREPFGFIDGISQPFVEGLKRGKITDRPSIPAGEFVLGYPNALGNLPASPSVAENADPNGILPRTAGGRPDLGRNGTFLVLRQLEQDVAAFQAFVGADEKRGARMVGRWENGAPLATFPDKPESGFKGSENEFRYHAEDRYGFRCPIGAHIRRANPRDALADGAGLSPQAAQALVNQHRIIRRGRVYDDNGQQGIVLVALNANIERQFEFIQQNWVMGAEFGGLHDETDPLLGNAPPNGVREMTVQNPRLGERVTGLGQFVTVKGGEYFFLPGLTALRYLSN